MDKSANAFSYFVGGLALISTMLSGLLYFRTYLPPARMKLLDELLIETKNIYDKANTEGFLPHEAATSAKANLDLYEEQRDFLCEMIYSARTISAKIACILHGQTMLITALAADVEKLRAFLMTTHEREKARRRSPESQNLMREQSSSANAESGTTETTDEPCIYQPSPDFMKTLEPSRFPSVQVPDPSAKARSRIWPSFSIRWWKSTGSDRCPETRDCDSLSISSTLVNELPSSARRWWNIRNHQVSEDAPSVCEQCSHNAIGGETATLDADVASLPV